MPQQRLDSLWGSPSAKISNWQLKVEEIAKVAEVVGSEIDKGIKARAEVKEEFVRNGSRDRYGKMRTNIGGRPKKIQYSSPLASPVKSSPAKKRQELPAVQKIQMIEQFRSLEDQVIKHFPGYSSATKQKRSQMLQKLIEEQLPTLKKTRVRREIL